MIEDEGREGCSFNRIINEKICQYIISCLAYIYPMCFRSPSQSLSLTLSLSRRACISSAGLVLFVNV